MYDYTLQKVYLNSYVVSCFTVVGIAAEYFWRLAIHDRRGFNALSWSSVRVIEMRNVIINDRRHSLIEVGVPQRDAEMALRVARAVVERLEKAGFRMLDAIVPQKDVDGGTVGEHDLIAERFGKHGKSSVEVKCRCIKDGRCRDTFRRQIQCQAYKLWPAAIAKKNHDWSERVCVLVEFSAAGAQTWSAIRCEALPATSKSNALANWRPLFGWDSALSGNSSPSPSQRSSNASTVVATARDTSRKRAFEASYAKCRKCALHGSEMRSVSDLLIEIGSPAAKRAKPTIGERMPKWAKKFQWPPWSWTKTPQVASSTGGGRKGLVATKGALQDIHSALC